MAGGSRGRKKRARALRAFALVLLLFLLVPGLRLLIRRQLLPRTLVPGAHYLLDLLDPDAEQELLEGSFAGHSPPESQEAFPQAAALPEDLSDCLLVDFLDVGQADATLIRQGDHAMLFDCGAELPVQVWQYLKRAGVDRLDLICLSHMDADHINAFPGVAYHCPISQVLMGPALQGRDTTAYDRLMECLWRDGIPYEVPQVGQVYELGDATLQVVGPVRRDEEIENNNSLAVRICYGDTALLLCGDAQSEEEADLASGAYPLAAQLLHVNHHGSNSSSTEGFLDCVSPVYGVISCGTGNDYGHPGAYALARLAARGITVFRTDLQGTLTFFSDGLAFYPARIEKNQ